MASSYAERAFPHQGAQQYVIPPGAKEDVATRLTGPLEVRSSLQRGVLFQPRHRLHISCAVGNKGRKEAKRDKTGENVTRILLGPPS